jgi:hypothetical protein
MWLEDFSPEIESSEWVWQSSENTKESSEKYRESSKKAWAKIAKTWKDEKKAKKYDVLLAGFLVKIIIDTKYDSILETLFPAINWWYPSNFILWILSLINIEISNKIREASNKEKIIFNYKTKKEAEIFDDNNINAEIKSRINYWVEDIIDSVSIEYSNIATEKLKKLLKEDEDILLAYTSKTFSFFLNKINIKISKEKSENISEFILKELKKSIDNLKIEKI